MKKIITLGLLLLAGAGLTAGVSLRASWLSQETTTTVTWPTTTPETTTTQTAEGWKEYTYVNLQDLIDQMYADIAAQIYADLYAELSETLLEGLDQTIYDAVLAQVQAKIDEGTIVVPLDDFQETINEVVALASSSVVGVTTYIGQDAKALGSGVIYHYDEVTDRYYLMTNEHVVEGGDNYKVVFEDDTAVTATLVGANASVDIAVLWFSGTGLDRPLAVSPLGDSDTVTKGEIVLAVGHPRGYDFYGSVTMGVVSGLNRQIGTETVRYIQHDASINSGNSGGPIYNLQGEVIGINVSKYASTEIEGMGFAIPINTALAVIRAIAPGTAG
jgi:S1-C subfamily serine protease